MKTKKTRKRLPICSPQIECFLLFYGFCHSRRSVGPAICKRTNWRAHLGKDNCFRFCYFPLGRSYQTFSWALSVQFIGHQWMKSNYHPFLSLHSPNYRWMWIKGMKHKIFPKSRRNEALCFGDKVKWTHISHEWQEILLLLPFQSFTKEFLRILSDCSKKRRHCRQCRCFTFSSLNNRKSSTEHHLLLFTFTKEICSFYSKKCL